MRDGPIEFDADQLGAHEGAGRAFWIAQQGEQVFPVFGIELLDDLRGALFGQLGNHVHSIVRIQVFQDILGNLAVGEVGHQGDTDVFFEFNQHISPVLCFDEVPEVLDFFDIQAV